MIFNLLETGSGFVSLLRTSPGFALFFLLLVVIAIYFGFRYAKTHQMKDLIRQRKIFDLFHSEKTVEE